MVQVSTFHHGRHRVHPGLPGGESEHGDEGAVKLAEGFRGFFAVQRHSKDRVCQKAVSSPPTGSWLKADSVRHVCRAEEETLEWF